MIFISHDIWSDETLITIRRAGQTVKTLDGSELLKKVTNRAIKNFLCDLLCVKHSMYDPSKVEYQPVYTRGVIKDRVLKSLRLRQQHDSRFTIISIDEIHRIGVSESQILDYLSDSGSVQIKALSGSLI